MVYCPESRHATATQAPSRRNIHAAAEDVLAATGARPAADTSRPVLRPPTTEAVVLPELEALTTGPHQQHFTIYYGDTGHSYESLLLSYLAGATQVEIEDHYIRAPHQIQNFVRCCEALIKAPTLRRIVLTSSDDDQTDLKLVAERLEELKQSLLELDIALAVQVNDRLHDREIRIDTGWVIKIGRGLDLFHRPES